MATKRKSPQTRRPPPRRRGPSFGGGILADNVTRGEAQKPTAQGIFTVFWAWAYPCDRTWHTVATVFDLPKRRISCTISIRKRGSSTKDKLGSFTVAPPRGDGAVTVTAQVSHRFQDPGRYEVVLAFSRANAELRLPFEVRTREWPEFTKAEVNFAVRRRSFPGTMRASVECPTCQAAYIFEERILTDIPLPAGVHEFPASGVLECGSCGNKIYLRDIQGQIRQSLKERVVAAKERRT